MFCGKCGNKLPLGAKFCSRCGSNIEEINNSDDIPKIIESVTVKMDPIILNEVNNRENNSNNSNASTDSIIGMYSSNNGTKSIDYNIKPIIKTDNNSRIITSKSDVILKPDTNNNHNVGSKNGVNSKPLTTSKSNRININKVLVALIILVVVIVGVISFSSTRSFNKSRTIMIYMVGANLESDSGLATRDLQDLDYQKISSNNINVVMMAGGTPAWKNNYVDVNETSIYELGEGGFSKIDSRVINNMGSSDNLSYFLNYVYNNYKTNKYDLIFWNHGGAVDGSEYDEIVNDNLKLYEMRNAFDNSPFTGKNKLEVISFRTCLNGTIEVANVYKDYAEYLVASEEITIGSPAASALKFINEVTPKDNAISYSEKIINAYKNVVSESCNQSEYSDVGDNYCVNSTYSIVDLSKIEKLTKKFDEFSYDINGKVSSDYSNMAKLRANIGQYAVDSQPEFDMIDLYDFVEKYKSYSNKANSVQKLIEDAVIYNWTNNNYSHGLSIYFPYNSNAFLNDYSGISASKNYSNFVSSFYNMKTGQKISSYSSFSSTKGVVKDVKKDKADFELELTDEQVENFAKANYYVFVDTKDGYYQILYAGKTVTLDGNTLKAKVQGKQLRFSDIEYEDESIWLTLIENEVTDEYVELTTTASLHNDVWSTVIANVIIRIDEDHPNGYITSINSNNEGKADSRGFSVFSKTGLKLSDYIFMEFGSQRYKLIDENGNYNPNWSNENNGIYRGMELVTDEFKFVKEDFSSDYDYYALFRIWDTSNNDYYSDVVKMNK